MADEPQTPEEVAAQICADYAEYSVDQRAWLKALLPYYQCVHEQDADPAVQKHLDDVKSAIYQRIQRIVESDLPRRKPDAQ